MAAAQQTLEQFAKEVIASMKKNNGKWEKMFGENINAFNSVINNSYRGINQLMLSFTSAPKEYKNNIWASYKQWQSIGAQVNKGSKGTGIIFYKPSVHVSKKTGKVTTTFQTRVGKKAKLEIKVTRKRPKGFKRRRYRKRKK